MYKLEIRNKKGDKRIADCSDRQNINSALKELGIRKYQSDLNIGENSGGETLTLITDNEFDAALAKMHTQNGEVLSDVLFVREYLSSIKDKAMQAEVKRNAINGRYETKEDVFADVRRIKKEFSAVCEDFYCPIHASIKNNLGKKSNVTQENLAAYEEEVRLKMTDEQTVIMDMTGRLGDGADIDEKLNYAEWGVEAREGTLYGKISCYFSEALTGAETERLKDEINRQNSDGFGAYFEKEAIKVDDGKLHVSLREDGDYFLKTNAEMDEYLQKDDIKMGGI